jgi:GT2 family glycosyltransferase
VVDNHSQDDSVVGVRKNFPEVELIICEQNSGFSQANNLGARCSHGEYLLFLNNDTQVLEGSIKTLLDFLKTHPEAGLVGAKLLNPDGTSQRQGRPLIPFLESTKPLSVGFLPAAAVMMKRELFEKLGGFDENYFFYNEDLDLCQRLRRAGYKIYYLPSSRVIHFGGSSTAQLGQQAMIEGYLGGLRYCYKFYPRSIFYLYRALVGAELRLKLFLLKFKKLSRDLEEKQAAWAEILKRYCSDERIYRK